MSFPDQKPFVVTAEHGALIKKKFLCAICGHQFQPGDTARWVYCNSTPGQSTGNFFVCPKDDGPDEEVRAKGKENYKAAVAGAKRWNIYGPDWEADARRYS